MKTLVDILCAPEQRDSVLGACVQIFEGHVSSRGGLKGMGMKTGLAMVKVAKPDIVPRALGNLLPEFAVALQPLYVEFQASQGDDFTAYISKNIDRASSALIGVLDAKAASTSNSAARSLYQKFRGGAEDELAQILPALGGLIRRFA